MVTRRVPDSGKSPRATAAVPAPAPKSSKRRASAGKTPAVIATASAAVSADERRAMIALAAYVRAERRGFAAGGEAQDWLAAEKEIDALLSGRRGPTQ
jgi:hypothetical protein